MKLQNLRKAMNKNKGETKVDETKKLIESFKEIYAKNREIKKIKQRQYKTKFQN